MKTDDLIEALAAGLEPAASRRLDRTLMLASGVAFLMGVAGVLALLGLRPDLVVALGHPTFWLKAAYTGGLAAAGGWLFARLGRPGTSVRAPFAMVIGLLLLAVTAGGLEQLLIAPEMRPMHWLGHSASVCSRNILMLAAFGAPFVFWAARRFAPTRPTAAGAAAGLLTGAVAATAYGLSCPEATASFVATWYSLGMLGAAAVGAVAGRRMLRW